MKSDVGFDNDGWMDVSLTAETAEDAARLVQLAMNRNADIERVFGCNARDGKVAAWISLKPRRDNSGHWLKHSEIPKAK